MEGILIFAIIIAIIIVLTAVFIYFREYRTLPEFAMPLLAEFIPKKENVVIFAPHSDDEVLGVGGFIYKAVKKKANVIIVLVTNGDGHRFSTMEEFMKLYPSPNNYIESGYKRQEESVKALSILGVKRKNIIFFGYPDLGIEKLLNKNWTIPFLSQYTAHFFSPYKNSFHKKVAYTGENLQNDIIKILKKYLPKVIIMPHILDIHPDHSSTAVFVQRAIYAANIKTNVYSYLTHFKRFPHPKGLHKNRFLTPPAKLITFSDGWYKLSLNKENIDAKENAMRQYKSQFISPFLKNLMESFVRQNELLAKG